MGPFGVCLIEFLYMFAGRAFCDPEAPPGGPRPSQEGLPPLCRPQHRYRQENGLSRNHPPRWIKVFVAGHCSTYTMVMFILIAYKAVRGAHKFSAHPPDHLLSFLQET